MPLADLSDECVTDKTGRRLSDVFCGTAVTLVFSGPVCVCARVCVRACLSGVRATKRHQTPSNWQPGKERDLTDDFE